MTIFGRTVTRMNRQTFPSQLRRHHHPWVILPDPSRSLGYVSTGNSDYPSPEHTLVEPKPGSVTIKNKPDYRGKGLTLSTITRPCPRVNYVDSLCVCFSCENGSKYLSRGVTQQLRMPAAFPGNPGNPSLFPSCGS